MNRIMLFILVTMTIFALLFVISFIVYRNTLKELKETRLELSAIKNLLKGNVEDFVKTYKKLGKKESDIEYLISSYADLEFERGILEFKNGNYSLALKHFMNAYELTKDSQLKILSSYYIGIISNKRSDYESAMKFLKVFLNKHDNPFYKDALLELANAAKHLKENEILEKIEKILKNDPKYYKKFKEVTK